MIEIARGRQAIIYALDDDRVLRRSLEPGASAIAEARLMRYLADAGYPVPHVYDATQNDLVMERLAGPTMTADLVRRPWRSPDHAGRLADLHKQLHAIEPPTWLPATAGDGSQLVHMDLHPGNVMLSERGPTVIDWTSAQRSDALNDPAQTWLLTVTSDIPVRGLSAAVVSSVRRPFLAAFLRHWPRPALREHLVVMAHRRLDEDHLSDSERRRIQGMLAPRSQ